MATHSSTSRSDKPLVDYISKTTGHKLTRVSLPPLQLKAASTANLASLSSVTSIDGVSLTGDGNPGSDLILLKDQTTAADNGIYWANTSGAMARADEPLVPNRAVLVSEGDLNATRTTSS